MANSSTIEDGLLDDTTVGVTANVTLADNSNSTATSDASHTIVTSTAPENLTDHLTEDDWLQIADTYQDTFENITETIFVRTERDSKILSTLTNNFPNFSPTEDFTGVSSSSNATHSPHLLNLTYSGYANYSGSATVGPLEVTSKREEGFSNQDIWFIITGAVILGVIVLTIVNFLLKYGPAMLKMCGYGARGSKPPTDERRVRRDLALLAKETEDPARPATVAGSLNAHQTQTHVLLAGVIDLHNKGGKTVQGTKSQFRTPRRGSTSAAPVRENRASRRERRTKQ